MICATVQDDEDKQRKLWLATVTQLGQLCDSSSRELTREDAGQHDRRGWGVRGGDMASVNR